MGITLTYFKNKYFFIGPLPHTLCVWCNTRKSWIPKKFDTYQEAMDEIKKIDTI